MKKYIIALGLSFLLISCGSTEVKETPNTNTTKSLPIETPKETPKEAPKTTSTEEKLSATMEEIFKKGTANTCTFVFLEEGQTANGTLYVDSGKMRYTMGLMMQGQKVTNDVIVKDDYSYSWSNMQPGIGYKFKESSEDSRDTKGSGAEMEAEERNKKIDFTCKSGVPSGVFDIPSNIKFEEYSIPQMPQGME